jgi:hypothetical protein
LFTRSHNWTGLVPGQAGNTGSAIWRCGSLGVMGTAERPPSGLGFLAVNADRTRRAYRISRRSPQRLWNFDRCP